jgi:hypothetical protein
MKLLIVLFLKTTSMKKTTWKSVLLYIVRILELVLTGAAGGALGADLF